MRTSMGRGCLMRWSSLRQFEIEVSVVVIVSFSIVLHHSVAREARDASAFGFASALRSLRLPSAHRRMNEILFCATATNF